ncbi:MAG: cation:proton antiporter [Chloroflexota bacterium]
MGTALLSLALLLIAAKVTEGLAVRLRQSPLVAYVLTGILLGPVLGLVNASPALNLFSTTGVVFLFFLIGTDEMDISGFVATLRGRFFLAGVVAFSLPLAIGFAVTHYVLDIPLINAVIVAGIIALSSLGILAKVLGDLGQLKKPLGLEIFTVVAIVELLGLLTVGFMLRRLGSADGFSAWQALWLLAQVVLFVVVAWALTTRLFPPVVIWLRRLLGAPQLTFGLLLGVLFLAAAGAEKVGLHASLGALLMGIALSGLPHRLRSEVMPSARSLGYGLFIPLFFVVAGLNLTTSFTALPAIGIVSIVLAVVLGKLAGAMLATRVARLDNPFPVASGLMAKGAAEIALLLVMLESGVISTEVFSLLTTVMLAFIIGVPPVIGMAIRRTRLEPAHTLPRYVFPSFARHALDNVKVQDILDKDREFAPASLSLKDFTERWVVPERQDYVIVEEERELAGILSLRQLNLVPRDQWEKKQVGQLVQRHVPRAWPDEPLDDVLERMARHSLSVIPVVEPSTGELLGTITSRDALSLIVQPEEKRD